MSVLRKMCSIRRSFGRDRVTEILKFIVAAALGFTLRVMMENTTETTVSSCPPPSKIGLRRQISVNELDYQLREPYKPQSPEDVIEYRFFSNEIMFDSHGATPQRDLKGYHLLDLKDCITETMNYINSDGKRYHFKQLYSGYERIDPLRGKEYLLDLEVTLPSDHRPGRHVSEFFRIHSVKPFTNTRVIRRQHIANLPSDSMYLIVSMYIEQEKNFYRFLRIYESHVARHRLSATLVLILFSSKDVEDHEAIYQRLEKRLNASKSSFSSRDRSHFRILRRYKEFSSQMGQSDGLSRLPQDAKLIFTDFNVNLTSDFYLRCSATLTSGDVEGGETSVYSPIPYSFFKSTDVSKSTPETLPEINNSNGYWDHENFQTFCLSKKTFETVGGFDTLHKTKSGWDHSRELFERIVKHKIKIIRSVDPAVYVSYHDLPCAMWVKLKYMSKDQCRKLMLKSLGSRTMLAQKFL